MVPADRIGEREEMQVLIAALFAYSIKQARHRVSPLPILKTSSSSTPSCSPEQTPLIQIRKSNRFKDVNVRKVGSAPSSEAAGCVARDTSLVWRSYPSASADSSFIL